MGRRKACPVTGPHEWGQSIVEFALVIPIFLAVIFSIADFSFFLVGRMGVTYSSQDAAQMAAQMGPKSGADCAVLGLIERDISAPMDKSRIQSVEIFWAGHPTAVTRYTRGGSVPCPDGTTRPYTLVTDGYPEDIRCNVLGTSGGCPGHSDVDWIGVTITYQHYWLTPIGGTLGGSTGPTLVETTTTRMEPSL